MATRTTKVKDTNGGVLKVEKVRKDVQPADDQDTVFELGNIGPFNILQFKARPGVNLVGGGIEAGKSEAMKAIEASRGTNIPVSVKDGETEGYVKRDGRILAEFKRPKGKQPYITLASVSPVSLVVNPGIKGADAAEETRIRGLVDMVGLKTTEETIQMFLTPEPRSRDEQPQLDAEAYDYVDENYGIESLTKLDPVSVVDVLLKGKDGQIHKLRRKYERLADEAAARYNPPMIEVTSKLTVAQAERAYEKAVGDHRQLQGEASQRAQLERQRAEIETTLGDEPDADAAVLRAENIQNAANRMSQEIAEKEAELAALRATLAEQRKAVVTSAQAARDAMDAALSWRRRKQILDTPITGATPADVGAAAARIEAARGDLQVARNAEEYQRLLDASNAARKDRDEALRREKEVKRLAESVPGRLGELFGQAGIPDARVVDGVFQVKNDQGKWEAFERRSEGAKWRIVLPIWIKHNPEGLLVMVKSAWAEFDIETQIEIHEILIEHDVIAFVEVTNGAHRGEPIQVKPFQPTA